MTEISAIITAVHCDVAATVGLGSYRALATAPLREAKRDAIIRLNAFAVSAVRVGRWLRLRTVAASAPLVQLAAQIQERCNKRRGFREFDELDDRLSEGYWHRTQ